MLCRELTQPPPPSALYLHLLWYGLMRGQQKDLEGERKASSYSLGPEPHHSILQPVKVKLFISEDQHISLLQAPTQFLCPIFSLSPLSIHLSLSYSLANGKTVLGWILFFKGINSPLYTLDLTLWQALSVSSAWYTSCSVCWWTRPIITHSSGSTHSPSQSVHVFMHADLQPHAHAALQIRKRTDAAACGVT